MSEINCCRCDKNIKKPEISCFCQECVDKIAKWRIANYLESHYLELWNKAKSEVERLIDK